MPRRHVFAILAAVASLACPAALLAAEGAGRLEPPALLRRADPPQGAVIFDNGPIVTHPGAGAGGSDASALQTDLGMQVRGFGPPESADRVADDFTVPAGATWQIDSFQFYGYQLGVTPPDPTINHVNVRIWNGPPGMAGSEVVFGDTTTNRLASSTWANIHRVLISNLLDTLRPVYANVVTLGVTLGPGTYWIDWQADGTIVTGPYVPAVTVLGQTTTGNARLYFHDQWMDAMDVGPQGLPFKLNGPDAAVAPVALTVDGDGNKVMEPDETPEVAPSWRNEGTAGQTAVTGTIANFTGPAGATYTIVDGDAAYGDIAAGATATCSTDCYAVTVSATSRPAQHWDATVDETLLVDFHKTWTLHVGASFTDVAPTGPFYRFIETLLHKGVTGGCGADTYCPGSSTTREQMAVFVLVAKEGAGYGPAPCEPPNLFEDVPETSPYCRFVEELATRGVVAGCATGRYCPAAPVSREQMAIFVLRTLDGTLNPPACVAGSEMFADVPASSPFCKWIEELARRGVVTGCGGNNYCPTNPVTREQMGVFLSATFGLVLYAP